MEHKTAVGLIRLGVRSETPQRWADLGAGDGVFTKALASVLPHGSHVLAVDKNEATLATVDGSPHVSLTRMVGDFTNSNLIPSGLDGILMANSLHYISDKTAFIEMILGKLNPSGRIILVEYDLHVPNRWVPFPIDFKSLQKQAMDWSLKLSLLGRTPSRLNNADIYACALHRR